MYLHLLFYIVYIYTLYNIFCIYLLIVGNLSFEPINYCMSLHQPAVITVGYSRSVSESPEIFRVGENHPRRRFKKRKFKKKKKQKKSRPPKSCGGTRY